jgi:hypothetical protein
VARALAFHPASALARESDRTFPCPVQNCKSAPPTLPVAWPVARSLCLGPNCHRFWAAVFHTAKRRLPFFLSQRFRPAFLLPFFTQSRTVAQRRMSIPAYAEAPGDNHHRATTPDPHRPAAASGAGLLVAWRHALTQHPTPRAG